MMLNLHAIAAFLLLPAALVQTTGCFGNFQRDGGPCDGVTCSGHGECVLSDAGAALCSCEPGFEPSGTTCVVAAPDGDVETDTPPSCPPEMVHVPSQGACIDRYEASQGTGSVAVSVQGAMPWAEISWEEAAQACVAGGKRLCSEAEWLDGCRGAARRLYPYGDEYDPMACNGEDRGIGAPMGTSFNGRCEGGYPGLLDMSGNLEEWTASCVGTECSARGGAFDSDATGLRCGSGELIQRATTLPSLGFRCCLSL